MVRLLLALLSGGLLLGALPAQAQPDVTVHLYDGKLTAGEQALREQLAKTPGDDRTRCVLGIAQFLRGFEKLGTGLYRHGLKTSTNFPGMPRRLAQLLPENPKPEKANYAAIRKLVDDFVNDLDQAEKTLAAIKDEKLELPLYPGRLKVDLFGEKQLISAGILVGIAEGPQEAVTATEQFVIHFDRGDVSWLRGYLHFLCGWGEIILSLDTQDLLEDAAHRVFLAPETPHRFFLEEVQKRPMGGFLFGNWSQEEFMDAFATVYHAVNLPIKEPARMKRALEHFEGMIAQSKEMWKFILAETDDKNEWIPNPKQTGVLRIRVTEEIVKEWTQVLDEVDAIVQGNKLLPFWRGNRDGSVGVNFRKAFLNPPKNFDILRWVQGPGATPYLEKGPITPLADPRVITRMDRVFGGVGFFGFAFWFN